MSVSISFVSGGVTLNEITALDFGTVQAGTSSGVKSIAVTNSGSSDALQCTVDPKEALVTNGFTANIQVGTSAETWLAQQFAIDNLSASWYDYAVVGTGKNWTNKTGGTLVKNGGSDSYATKWNPPVAGASGLKVWGNSFSCTYVEES